MAYLRTITCMQISIITSEKVFVHIAGMKKLKFCES